MGPQAQLPKQPERKLTKEGFCDLLGVLPTNALVSQIWDALEYNGYEIRKRVDEWPVLIVMDDPGYSGNIANLYRRGDGELVPLPDTLKPIVVEVEEETDFTMVNERREHYGLPPIVGALKAFKDFTTKNENNLTGT